MIRYMKIAIIGYGREGQSLFRFIKKSPRFTGTEIWILDKDEGIKIPRGTYARLGKYYLRGLETFDLVFRSPGIPYMNPELVRARKRGVKFSSPTKLFFEEAARRGTRIIGVTGTKGKGTTSTLTYQILKRGGIHTFLAGNIGLPALDIVHKLRRNSWVVLELSSFQLIDLKKSPHIAVVLMVTSEHLDWHKNNKEYIAAKANIIRFQSRNDYAVIAEEYPRSKAFAKLGHGEVFMFSKKRRVKRGAWAENEAFWFFNGKSKERIAATSDLWIPGFHNFDNTCAAITAAKIAGVKNVAIRNAIREFRGLEHRLELVANIHGVKYYDDSYSTTPETAIVAIQAFSAPKILILGGSPKGSDFRTLGKVISESNSIRGIVGIGKEWPKIKSKIKNQNVKLVEGSSNMREIVKSTHKLAQPGDVVLLSPACASFGMFKNYTDRGDQFKKLVRGLSR